MGDQTTWKGHSFTLLVFAGIVVLCSIFFILGMLVGRGQGQKIADVAAAAELEEKTGAKLEVVEPLPALPAFEPTETRERPKLEQPAPKPEPAPAEPPVRPGKTVNYQISAVRKLPEAEKLLNQLKSKGFKAFILAPPAGDPNPLFRVQVGPFEDTLQAEQAKKKLESAGYKSILKR